MTTASIKSQFMYNFGKINVDKNTDLEAAINLKRYKADI